MVHFALRSNKVITNGEMIAACVEIKDQIIHAVHPHDQQLDCQVEDLGDLVLMPGLVDSHVHINEPGRTEWEGFNTATQAAAAGGITTLVDMPLNCIPVTVNKAAFQEKLDAVHDKLWVDCGFWGGVIPQNIGELDELLTAGVLGVKSFLIDSGIKEFPQVEADDIRKAMPILAKHDVPYLIHAELDCAHTPPATIGDKYQSFLDSRPKKWENDAVALMADLAKEAKANGHDTKVHIVHLSSAEALSSISDAKAQGLQFTAETCPHYLTLHSEAIPDGKTLFKCCPPIREDENRQTLWQAVEDGRISFIVSDHSPCTPELKHIDTGDIEKAWGGISALQFGISLIWTEAQKRGFDLVEINRLMSAETAKFAGLDSIKGQIAPGYHADLLVFDDRAEYEISNDMIKHRHKITPYVGKTVSGRVEKTYVRGQLVYRDDEFVASPVGRPLLKGKL
ncbi:allantoinase AllB [Thalassomonas haliotis]|uniref:allantoinase n=1 Tax=Thalassomonas haliotis TaxID=485448 RepID=A0ABY7VM97_9GAMM|nr:allantoinase AllB [Thalassomonas haliotis]WDE14048.1 allantoinase AllB [Thalassomonas haliotis]